MSAMTSTQRCGCPDYESSLPSLGRRGFLGGAGLLAGAMTAGSLFDGAHRQVAYGANPDGNVVIVLSLRGGSDGVSVIVPKSPTDQAHLQAKRPGIIVPTDRLIGSDPRFGLHPALAPLLPMWTAGTFGAVHAVGMSQPNRSHFSSMEQVERAAPGSGERTGWINRAIGLDPAAKPEEAMQIGSNMVPAQLVGPAASLGIDSLNDLALPRLWNDQALAAGLRQTWSTGTSALRDGVLTALDVVGRLEPVTATDLDPIKAQFPEGPLREVLANTVALVNAQVGAKVITIDYGDWDMHTGLGPPDPGNWMYDHLTHLARSLKAFFAGLSPAMASKVTVVTISEFGRRIEQNGENGVDHGYGNCMLLFGAGVRGGQVHGQWPGLADDDLIDGDLAVKQDYRSVLWEVLSSRFPQSPVSGSLSTVFPGFTPDAGLDCMS